MRVEESSRSEQHKSPQTGWFVHLMVNFSVGEHPTLRLAHRLLQGVQYTTVEGWQPKNFATS